MKTNMPRKPVTEKQVKERFVQCTIGLAGTTSIYAALGALDRWQPTAMDVVGVLCMQALLVYVFWPWRGIAPKGTTVCCECSRARRKGESFCYGCGHACQPAPKATSRPTA